MLHPTTRRRMAATLARLRDQGQPADALALAARGFPLAQVEDFAKQKSEDRRQKSDTNRKAA